MLPIHELKVNISQGRIENLYVFFGEEIAIMNLYINQIAKHMNVEARRVHSLKDISGTLTTKGFLDSKKLYVIRDDKHYQKQEKVWPRLIDGEMQGDNTIILLYTKVDKRSKFFKAHTYSLTEFEKLPEEVLAKYVERDIGLATSLAIQLCRNCENDYSRIMLECDKLVHLKAALKIDNIGRTYNIAMENQLIHLSMGEVLFDFIDTVTSRNYAKAYKLKLYLNEQNVMGMLSLFYMKFKAILIVKSGGAKQSSLSQYQLYHAAQLIDRYSQSELVRIIKKIRYIEKGIKTGLVLQELALDYLLVNIL